MCGEQKQTTAPNYHEEQQRLGCVLRIGEQGEQRVISNNWCGQSICVTLIDWFKHEYVAHQEFEKFIILLVRERSSALP